MKFYNKFISTVSVAAVGAMLFTGCQKDFEYTPGDLPTDDQVVVFPPSSQTYYDLDEDANSITIQLSRINSAGALTVALSTTCTSDNDVPGAFTFPTSATFNAGESTTNIVITYNLDMLKGGVQYQYNINIDENVAYPYGMTGLDVTLVPPELFLEIGTGWYCDYFWGVSATSDETQVTFYQSNSDENKFQISNPYVALNGDTESRFEFRVLQEGETYRSQKVPQTGLVGYDDYLVEYYDYYDDDLYILFPGRFSSLAAPSNWIYNYVYEYQANGLPGIIVLSPYYYMFNVGGWNQTAGETIEIYFPGVDF